MKMLLFNNDPNQTYSISLSSDELESMESLSASATASSSSSSSSLWLPSSASSVSSDSGVSAMWNFDKLPSAKALLNSEWLQQNMSQMLNMSSDNLTNLFTSIQQEPVPQSQRSPMPLLATLTVCYTLIFIAGVLGNLITCIVISRNKIMHTATNFYLFNLAVSDLILLLSGMPQDLYNLWYPDSYPFTDVLCVMEGVLSETAANATVLTITAFTVERYIAICHPFRQHTMSKLSRAVKFILAIWLTAFVLALPQAMQFTVVPQHGGTACTINNDFFAHVFAVSGFIFFGGPMTAICVLYVLIGVKLKRSRLLQAVPRRCYDVNRGISAQTRVIRMLIAVAVAFFLCWAPFHAQRLMAVYGSTSGIDSEVFNTIYYILDYTSGVLYFLSTCINPLLYNIMSHKFREAFKVTLARHFLSGKYQSQNHNYSALLRQNGSLRMHHTTDSIRTTTTTTTVNSGNGSGIGVAGGAGGGAIGAGGSGTGSGNSTIIGGHHHGHHQGCSNSCRSSQHRNRCASMGSQSTLLNSQIGPNTPAQHRLLQTQISQLSSVGDANSLMECDMTGVSTASQCHHPSTAYRLKEMRRQRSRGNDDCHSIDSSAPSHNWRDDTKRCVSMHETELYTKPMAPHIMAATLVATQPIQPMHSIAELSLERPTRSRLKLSRIITRRQQDAFALQSSPRVELMRPQYKVDKTSVKTINSLADKFKWRTKRKLPKKRTPPTLKNGEEYDGSTSLGPPLPTTALMKVVYTTAAGADLEPELTLNTDGSLGYRTPHAL
ncbi:neuropeptide CCHamide-2 receptor-like isoform X2 [Calliphora vicina]|uniref:neuropeptide CCHamide-2 receptor-like isoform X2 n=1 Tax=Calliphora vicina TaxID=7373 RepID=UPI00325B5224